MTRDELKQSGLLDQYVLGLTTTETTELIDRMRTEDPFVQQEIDRLRGELDAYADALNFAPPAGGVQQRSVEEFLELDHEMILAITERNHTLSIWRYGLVAACVALMVACGYLFRLKENYKQELVHEQSLHAQDNRAHEKQALLDQMEIRGVTTALTPLDSGDTVSIHQLVGTDQLLVDLSQLTPPPAGHSYFVFTGTRHDGEPAREVRSSQLTDLFPVQYEDDDAILRIYRWKEGKQLLPPLPPEDLVARVDLPVGEKFGDPRAQSR